MKITRSQLSEHSGKSRQAIAKAIKAGRLKTDEDGNLDTDDPAVAAFIGNQNASDRQATSAKDFVASGSKYSRAELENKRIEQQIIKLQLENSIKSGDLVARSVVENIFIRPVNELFIRMISDMPRTILLNVKGWIKSGMSDAESEKELKRILEQNVKKMKEDLDRGFD
jgi:hypothetical protein